ncbi:MAG TPA: FdhF/YdeP family oxidoreductase [Sphingomonas sp.]|nr:FdhF/YdeP family oxidoreductase [Sphingomonas sp.]
MSNRRTEKPQIRKYDSPAGGWGSMRGLKDIMLREKPPAVIARELLRQNKPDGFVCVSCAWAKPAHPHVPEFCENGAKATAWELTRYRTTPDFFSDHTLAELRGWQDYDLEQHGRLTHPLRYDPATDRYVAVAWEEAFAEIGKELQALDPKSVVFYSSGRASLETSFMYQLMARMYGNQNLPDSSNMCHESTSVGLKKAIGAGVGTVLLEDFERCDAIFFFGQNVGSNSPRMLHQLKEAVERGCRIVTFNPLKEPGLLKFTNPQNVPAMLTRSSVKISDQYHQVKAGGDMAAIAGLCKALIAWDDQSGGVLDHEFLKAHTHGFEAFAAAMRALDWQAIEHQSGLTRAAIESAAAVYADSTATIGVYGMGLTQHRFGVDNVRMIVNLLLLKGNIGRAGAGVCPVRGHSNVQGQRTVGITEKPELAPLDTFKERYDFEPPREKGLDTVETCAGVIDGSVRGFVQLGGNFLRAVPDTDRIEPAWSRMRLTVHIATKLNRSHLVPGEICYLLPCLGRIERDVQASGPQVVTVEDSTGCIHASRGKVDPAGKALLSEPAIVAAIAEATLAPNPKVDWQGWVADYGKVRDEIEACFPDKFQRFNERMFEPGGFYKGNKARERIWETPSGKAEFEVPPVLTATGFEDAPGRYRLMTLRSNDQFNTTIYGYSDRFRGVEGTRDVLFMSPEDIAADGLKAGQIVSLVGDSGDNVERRVDGLMIVPYSIPRGCLGGYYPECNPLIPLFHHARESHVPAGKSVPVRIVA